MCAKQAYLDKKTALACMRSVLPAGSYTATRSPFSIGTKSHLEWLSNVQRLRVRHSLEPGKELLRWRYV